MRRSGGHTRTRRCDRQGHREAAAAAATAAVRASREAVVFVAGRSMKTRRAEPPRGRLTAHGAHPRPHVANRLLSLIDGPRDAMLHAPGLALEAPGVRMVAQADTPRGAWRSFDDGRTGGSKGAFLRFASSSSYDHLWQIEEDAFYTGKCRRSLTNWRRRPPLARELSRCRPARVAAPPWLRDCAVGAAPCFAPPAPLRKTMWRSCASAATRRSSPPSTLARLRYMEALAAPFGRAADGCVAASIPTSTSAS